ncbi:hypothetical protein [Glycomyces xiaoerkulensis]|uniref:hypothetical protein n=1 Tax=Glycomyces xiaoerkulensis TaxID=2038139 RepID=UPI0013000983|nr:hypothetical protein [Glycomyces xiaoerkulensis]
MTEAGAWRPREPVLSWVPANEVDVLTGEQVRDRLRAEIRAIEEAGGPADSPERLEGLLHDVRAVIRDGGPPSRGLIIVASWLVGLRESGVDRVPVRTLTALADAIDVGIIAWKDMH